MNFGHKIIRLDSVDSTNNYATNLNKRSEIASGTVILADEQTAGKGQRGSTWESKAGFNLLFTLFVKPDSLSPEDQVVLNYYVPLCICKVLRKIGISAKIKWPNDIYVNGKKIAGILIENTISKGRIDSSVIGIGLNVNEDSFPDLNGTSIKLEIGEFRSINEILFILISQLNEDWSKVQFKQIETLKKEYLENMYLLYENALFEDKTGVFSGEITGLSDSGLLLIRKEGAIHQYDLKEIKFLDRNAFLNFPT